MKTEFQDLDWAIPKVIKQFRNPNRSISATFRYLRNHPRFQMIGDYPILAVLVQTVVSLGITINRTKLTYALNTSEELQELSKSEKSSLIDQLLNTSSVQSKHSKNDQQSDKNNQLTNASVTNSTK